MTLRDASASLARREIAGPEGRAMVRGGDARWTFLTNHGHVLICIAKDPHQRLRDIAEQVGITERAVQGIVSELEADGYLTRHRVGRRNEYEVHADRPFRHPVERDHRVGEMLRLMVDDPGQGDAAAS